VTETTRLAPLGKSHLRVTVWAVPGREPGQTRNLRHLIWSGPGDYVHLCYGGITGPGRRRRLRIRAADIGGSLPG
jgi:hypothetical protein